MIQSRRRGPRPALVKELMEEVGRIIRIGGWLECLIQRGEGVRVVKQVHLHAPDIDRPDPFRLQCSDGSNGLLFALEEAALSLGVDGPWPGVDYPGRWIAPTTLDPADRGQKMRWNAMNAFRGRNRPTT